jgi:alkanesulfonate monooxygenase
MPTTTGARPGAHWFLPSNGDGRFVANVVAREGIGAGAITRPPTVDYLAQVAQAAETAGFDGALTPTGQACEDAWVLTAALTQRTRRLRFIVAFRPGFILPALAAQQARSFQRLSGDRLVVNIVTGGDPVEQRAYGDFLSHDERYARTGEFLDVFRRSWDDVPLDFDGEHFRNEGLRASPLEAPRPEIFFGGASPAAEQAAARFADVYLAWGEPPEALRGRIERVAALAAGVGRALRFGVRLHVIARDTAAEAWAEADRLLAGMDPATIEAAQQRFARMDSVGQQRMSALNAGRRDDLLIAPNLWAGVGLVREGAGTALVGSHDEVADRLAELHAIGFEEFILSGWPHVEEAYRVGENVLPRLYARVAAGAARPVPPASAPPASPPDAARATAATLP